MPSCAFLECSNNTRNTNKDSGITFHAERNMMISLLLFGIVIDCVLGDIPAAKFTLRSVYDTETRWGPKHGEEYLSYMQIFCAEYLDPMPLTSPWKSAVSPNIIHILNCTLPALPLSEAFRRLNFDTTQTDKLKLTDVSLPNTLPKDYSAGLRITKLELTNVTNMTKTFFANLTELYKITVENMDMPPLIATQENVTHPRGNGRVIVLSLMNTTMKDMVNCEFIEDLTAEYMEEYQITEWPKGCGGRLRTLRLKSMSRTAVQKMAGIRPYLFIESLIVNNCSLVELPLRLLRGLGDVGRRVFSVSLPNNFLEDTALLQFPKFLDMNYLDLSNNSLTGECLRNIIPNIGGGMNNLNKLYLDGNKFNVSIFEDDEIRSLIANQPSLQTLSLSRMQLKPDCLKETHFRWLTHLNLASNSTEFIDILQLRDLPHTGAAQITVDLRGHGVRSVRIGPNFTDNFEKLNISDLWLTSKGYKLVVLLDFVDCDCNNDVLHRALKQFPEHLSMPLLKCNSKNGGFFLEESIENLNCRRALVDGCKRKLSRDRNYTTLVDCSNIGDRFRWPRPRGLLSLNVSGNGITSLRNAYLPESLERLDLRNNNLSRLSFGESALLFRATKKRVWLAGNMILCTCENRKTLEELQKNQAKIVDYSEVQCLGGRPVKLLEKVVIFELCKSGYSDHDLSDFGLPEQHSEKKIVCPGYLEQERPLITKESFDTISLDKCILTMKPLDGVLKSLNINISSLRTLKLNQVVMPQYLERHYAAGLSVRNVELANVQNFHFNFFTYMGSLRRLTVKDMALPPLPPSNNLPLFQLTLMNSTMQRLNCVHLQNLNLTGMDQQQINVTWPEECGALRLLSLKNMTQEAVEHVIMITDGTSLKELSVNQCSLVKLPLSLMQHLDRLNVLDLSKNDLEDHAFSQIPNLQNLVTLNLAHNKLKGEFLIEIIPKLTALRNLVLDGNKFVHTFRNFEIKSSIAKLMFLEELSLNDMVFDSDCLMHSNFSALTYLGLRAVERQKVLFKLHGLPRTGAAKLNVDLRGRSFKSVQIERNFNEDFENQSILDFWITNKGYNLEVSLDYVDCVCNNDVLSTTLRDFSGFLSMPNLRCDTKDGSLFIEEPLEKLNCLKATVNGCRRRISRDYNYVTTVDCSHNPSKFKWPRPDKKYHSLNASGNGITSLRDAYLPVTLKVLDLSNNSISRLDKNQTSLLFNSTRQFWLSGNPVECDCDNSILLNALRTNHSQIMDYDEITCAGSEQFVRLVSVNDLCRFKVEFLWWSLVALVILALTAALLLRHYWLALRMYMYSHGYCLSWLHEGDVDEDRPFDAFLSFAHGDNQYVLEKLLPQLEGEPNLYRMCVHYRDWAVGEWIPAQIMHSVRLSNRTIIILSKNFVTSLWGSMEFRCALASMESEGRSRLLLLVLDDVLSENLTPELRKYLEHNTYLRCDDPWFWEKLRFAMPRKKRLPNTRHSNSSELLSMGDLQSNECPNHTAPEHIQNFNNFEVHVSELNTI